MSNLNLTPLKDLYVVADLKPNKFGEVKAIRCLALSLLTDDDARAEAEHYIKTRQARVEQGALVPYGNFRTPHQGVVKEGETARWLCGDNLDRQSGCIRNPTVEQMFAFLKGGRGGSVVTATASVKEMSSSSLEEKLKAIRAAEAEVVAQMELIKEKEAAALTALAEKVAKFCKLDLETLKEVLTEAGATDLESGLEAAMAYSA